MGGSGSKRAAGKPASRIGEISHPAFEVEAHDDPFENPMSDAAAAGGDDASSPASGGLRRRPAFKVAKSVASLRASAGIDPERIAFTQYLTLGTNWSGTRRLRSLPEIVDSFEEDEYLPKEERKFEVSSFKIVVFFAASVVPASLNVYSVASRFGEIRWMASIFAGPFVLLRRSSRSNRHLVHPLPGNAPPQHGSRSATRCRIST
eukprot:SAG22_NODE_45_length_24718_cov_12.462448_18_plen_205_part_00